MKETIYSQYGYTLIRKKANDFLVEKTEEEAIFYPDFFYNPAKHEVYAHVNGDIWLIPDTEEYYTKGLANAISFMREANKIIKDSEVRECE